MSNKTVLHHARLGTQAEERILELLDTALRGKKSTDKRSKEDLHKSAPRQGQGSSG